MTRQEAIDAVPITALQNQGTDIASEDTSLTALNTAAAAVTTDLANIGLLNTGLALSATTTDATAVTATITGSTTPASYSITHITSVASAASETSTTGYANTNSANVVNPHGDLQMQLVTGARSLTFTLTAATNNLSGVAAAINSLDAGVTATVITTGSGSTDNYLSLSENSPGATTLQLNDLSGQSVTGTSTAIGSEALAAGTVLGVQGSGLASPINISFTAGETVASALAGLESTTAGSPGATLAAAGITVSGSAGGQLVFTASSGSVSVMTAGDTTNALGFGISTDTFLSSGSASLQTVTAKVANSSAAPSNGQTFQVSVGGRTISIGTGALAGSSNAAIATAAAAGLNAAIAANATLTAAGLQAVDTGGKLSFTTAGSAFSVAATDLDGVGGTTAGSATDIGFGAGSTVTTGPVSSAVNILTSGNQGSNSMFDLNGIPVNSPDAAISSVIPGITLNILGPTTAGETVGVTVATDHSAISAALTNLVTDYNTLAEQVNAQIGPSAGLLSGNPIVYQIREAMSALVHYQSGTGPVSNVANLGIEVNGDGTLTLDQTAFSALSDSAISSALSFFGTSTTGLGSLQSTFDAVSDPLTGSIAGQLSADTISTTNLSTQMARMRSQIAVSEATLLTELEAADAEVAGLQTQQNILTSSISSLQFTSYGYQSQATAAG